MSIAALIVTAPWAAFGAALGAVAVMLLRARRPGGRPRGKRRQ
jgi:hypothetical protein